MRVDAKAYLIGGGIGSLAAAAFMIRDGAMHGENIQVFDASHVVGGSLDAGGTAESGYSMRGGRMFTTDNYECTWDLFRSIPSLSHQHQSVFHETVAFNQWVKADAHARLVDRRRARVPVTSMGFSLRDRMELLRLTETGEDTLGASAITDWLSPSFFQTEFWLMWATTFAFQPWHSAIEFHRYLHRFMLEFTRIETLGGVKRTIYNQYDSLVVPLQRWLEAQGVRVVVGSTVTDLDVSSVSGTSVVTKIHVRTSERDEILDVAEGDLVILQNGSMTDASSVGSMTHAPIARTKADSVGWKLWEKLALGRPELGRPCAFNTHVAQSSWESFTVTARNTAFFDQVIDLTGNQPGTGGLMTFRDSAWLLSIVLPHQPHFADQPSDVQVFWGYALFPDRIGDFVPKPMTDCNGAEVLRELCGHLRFDRETLDGATCIPCIMPYITSMFLPRIRSDRPSPVPRGWKSFALVSQFVEIPNDVVFTVEYSIRAAQIAVYELLSIDRPVPAVTTHDKSPQVWLQALIKSLR